MQSSAAILLKLVPWSKRVARLGNFSAFLLP